VADDFVELRAFVAVEGAADRPDLDSLRGTVEDVLARRGVLLDLTRQGFEPTELSRGRLALGADARSSVSSRTASQSDPK
jgi:hypothetical protein